MVFSPCTGPNSFIRTFCRLRSDYTRMHLWTKNLYGSVCE